MECRDSKSGLASDPRLLVMQMWEGGDVGSGNSVSVTPVGELV